METGEGVSYACPKCGSGIQVSVRGYLSDKSKMILAFKCSDGSRSSGCDFAFTIDTPVKSGKILWPTQAYLNALFDPHYEQHVVLCKRVAERPSLEGPFDCEEEARRWLGYLLYKFPGTYCQEYKNVLDTRVKLWVLPISAVPKWIFSFLNRQLSEDGWMDDGVSFQVEKIADPDIRFYFSPKSFLAKSQVF